MASGVFKSWAAEASALVVLRKRSRNCSSSRRPSSPKLAAPAEAATVTGAESVGVAPAKAAAGLFSLIEDMDVPIKQSTWGGKLLPSERGEEDAPKGGHSG